MGMNTTLFFLICGIVCSSANIEERVFDLENVVQDQLEKNEIMKDRLKALELEVAELVAKEKEESPIEEKDVSSSIVGVGQAHHLLKRSFSYFLIIFIIVLL
jgi:hypothetical protein